MRTIKNFIIGLLLIGYSQIAIGQSATDNNIKQYAEKNIQTVLEKIPINDEKSFGFENREEFKQVEIGEPLEFILYTSTNNNISKKVWRIPIVVNGEYRALLNVQYDGKEYRVTDFGASVLANDIQKSITENTKSKIIGILRINAITSDFLISTNGDIEEYIPLTSAKMFISSRALELKPVYSSSNLIELLNER